LLKDKKTTFNSKNTYVPGTYTASIILHNNPVYVDVTVTEDEITSISLENMDEIQTLFYPLFRPIMNNLSEDIIKYQTLKVEGDSKFPVTSNILLSAVDSALSKAKKN
jgi:uncharacterized protein with FMN-binding domain